MTEPTPSIGDTSVVCAGIVVADHLSTPISHFPAAGELVKADDLVLNIGGCATNAAVALSKLGIRSSVCGRVGDDVFGRYIADVLSGYDVDCRALTVDHGRSTSQSLIINVSGQDRRFIHSFGANAGLSAEDVRGALRPETKVLYVGGYLIMPGRGSRGFGRGFPRGSSARNDHGFGRGHARRGTLSRRPAARACGDRRLPAQHRRSRADPGRARPDPSGRTLP